MAEKKKKDGETFTGRKKSLTSTEKSYIV